MDTPNCLSHVDTKFLSPELDLELVILVHATNHWLVHIFPRFIEDHEKVGSMGAVIVFGFYLLWYAYHRGLIWGNSWAPSRLIHILDHPIFIWNGIGES